MEMEKEDGDGDARLGWWKKEVSVKQQSKRCVAVKCCLLLTMGRRRSCTVVLESVQGLRTAS